MCERKAKHGKKRDSEHILRASTPRGNEVDNPEDKSNLEVERRDDRRRQDLNEQSVEAREELQVPARDEKLSEVIQRGAEPIFQHFELTFLSTVECNRLGILPHPNEGVAKVSLLLLLREIQADERPTKNDADRRATLHECAHVRIDRCVCGYVCTRVSDAIHDCLEPRAPSPQHQFPSSQRARQSRWWATSPVSCPPPPVARRS